MMHCRSRARVLAALALVPVLVAPTRAQNLPDGPAIWREVTGIENLPGAGHAWDPRFTRPHVPSFRTTSDGRIAVNVKGVPRITLLKPEKLDPTGANPAPPPFLHQPPGSYTMSWDDSGTNVGYVGGTAAAAANIYNGSTSRNVVHGCLWDDALPISNGLGQDVYDLKVLVTTNSPSQNVQIFVTPVTVVVGQPKTANAHIVSVTKSGLTLEGPVYDSDPLVTRQFNGTAFEPTIAGDGRLLVFRIGSPNLPVGPDGNTTPHGVDIVYSYYEIGATADPTKWLDVYPIPHAPYDVRVVAKFGFARNPFLDPRGQPIPEWEDLGGTYPWIDRGAKNLFFTTIGARLHTASSGWMAGRYGLEFHPDDPNPLYGAEANGITRGVAFAGLWSRGKTVLVDNLNNDMDYAIGNQGAPPVGAQQRLVKLFADGGPDGSGRLLLGYGRANHNPAFPPGENTNTTIIDSIENKLNTKRNAVPIAPRDVVWFVQNGKHTDQLVFDDYVDPDALVVASMAGLIRFPDDVAGTQRNSFVYDDGWNTSSEQWGPPASFPIRIQNAATAHHRWLLPPYGELVHSGDGRLEPAATGGVHGRGLWLEDGVGLRFDVPSQVDAPSGLDPDQRDAYVGLFVDCRFADDDADRLLLSFPDGSRLFLRGRSQILFDDGAGPVHFAPLPSSFTHTTSSLPSPFELFPDSGWTHVGLRIEDGGHTVTLLVAGLPLSRWRHPVDTLFRVHGGPLVVGDPGGAYGGASFRGWVDELKVLLHELDPETACNHANGTLVGVDPGASATSWARRFAESFPDWAHAELAAELRARGEDAHALYACFQDSTSDDAVYADALPADVHARADAVHFPEGPLYYDAPRPDTTTNRFCLSCHAPGEQAGLTLGALAHEPVDAQDDPRRQPMQPPPLLGGFIPALNVNAGAVAQPPADVDLLSGTAPTDAWLLPQRGAQTSQIGSVFLVAAGSGEPLLELVSGSTVVVDPAVLEPSVFTLQANLDAAQGAVHFSLVFPGPPFLGLLKNVPYAPYTVFKNATNPFAGRRFAAGEHRLDVTPAGSAATTTYVFEVLGGTPRRIAGYRDDFQDGSPAAGWFYAWNDGGSVLAPTSRLTLNWNPVESQYTETGADWPNPLPSELTWGALHANGGWPGLGTSQGVAHDRYVQAGLRVWSTGFVKLQAIDVAPLNPNTNGVDVYVLRESGGAIVDSIGPVYASEANPISDAASPAFAVSPGDVVWLAVGPHLHASADRFDLDFEVWFNETSW